MFIPNLLTFPNKSVKVVGASSSRFNYFGKMDKHENIEELPQAV